MAKRTLTSILIAALVVVFGVMAMQAQAPQAPAQKPAAAAAKPAAPAGAPAVKVNGPRAEDFLGKFPPLDFKVPKASEYRTTLSNGLVVYIAEDHEIPWFVATLLTPVAGGGGGGGRGRGMGDGDDQEVFFPQGRGGGGGGARSFLEPPDKLGIQSLCGTVMRTGGTATMTPDQINERMDTLAGSVSPTSLSIHTRHVDERIARKGAVETRRAPRGRSADQLRAFSSSTYVFV